MEDQRKQNQQIQKNDIAEEPASPDRTDVKPSCTGGCLKDAEADDPNAETADPKKLLNLVYAALFAALIAAGAYTRIALPFVPVTLQTFFVLMAAVLLGRKWGTVSVFIYLLVGVIGLPVFSGGTSGLGVLLGPTGGYLYSFVIVAYAVGFLAEKMAGASKEAKKKKQAAEIFLMTLGGSILILLIGTIHLKYTSGLPASVAFYSGFAPFVAGDMIKCLALALVAPGIMEKIRKKRG